ncbi:hypothetical protein FHR32_006111 [Streptosporangium album]|uniref:Uncharacterized protein n=1 Tax=Streptosporangium album TaxID=47479 RepID=A0A7W7S0N3_9ACTN|nr:hypothetical protein [Streptosporangium album]MBB4941734.1 hypothetical protein [Streptosporangium album]
MITDQYRHARALTVHAGRTHVTVHLAPVTTAGGWQLDRNHHRITVEHDGHVLHDEVMEDSPLQTAICAAASTLTGSQPLPPLDLGPLRRITALAENLHAQQPEQPQTFSTGGLVPAQPAAPTVRGGARIATG